MENKDIYVSMAKHVDTLYCKVVLICNDSMHNFKREIITEIIINLYKNTNNTCTSRLIRMDF